MKYLSPQYFYFNTIKSLLWLIILCVFSASLCAQENTIRVAISHFPPVEMMEKGQAMGINVNIMNTLFKRLGLSAKYKQMPFKRCLLSMEKGESDIIGSLQMTEDRKQYLDYLEPAYSEYHVVFYMRKDDPRTLEKYNDLYPLRVGVMRGYQNFKQFDEDNKIKKEPANSWKSNYLKLVKKRVDVIIDDSIEGPYRIHHFGLQSQVRKASYNFNAGANGFFAIAKKSPLYSRKAEFETALKEMIDSGEIQTIIDESLAEYTQ